MKSFSMFDLVAFEVIFLTPLILPPFPFRGVIFFSLLTVCYAGIVRSTTGEPLFDWCLGLSTTTQMFKSSDLLILSDPERDFWQNGKQSGDALQLGPWEKTKWAAELAYSPRGVGWNWEIPYISYSGTKSRRSFLLSRGCRCVAYYLLLDVINNAGPLPGFPGVHDHLFFDSLNAVAFVWSFAISAYISFWLAQTLPYVLLVLLGLASPEDFAHVLGPASAMFTFRRLWGRVWHQIARRQISSHGCLIARKLLRAPPGSIRSRYAQLYVGFAIGATTHAVAGLMAARSSSHSRWEDPTCALRVFASYAVVITMEDGLIQLMERCRILPPGWGRDDLKSLTESSRMEGKRRLVCWRRVFGYIWVVFWLTVTSVSYVEGLKTAGVIGPRFKLPFSVVRYVSRS
ncbi:MAG: hypothetical protein M1837_003398 [Sclerophora amabilis]|nr:MAG: hypothetical protein M1837_003398 [Sclerophora amabilis]